MATKTYYCSLLLIISIALVLVTSKRNKRHHHRARITPERLVKHVKPYSDYVDEEYREISAAIHDAITNRIEEYYEYDEYDEGIENAEYSKPDPKKPGMVIFKPNNKAKEWEEKPPELVITELNVIDPSDAFEEDTNYIGIVLYAKDYEQEFKIGTKDFKSGDTIIVEADKVETAGDTHKWYGTHHEQLFQYATGVALSVDMGIVGGGFAVKEIRDVHLPDAMWGKHGLVFRSFSFNTLEEAKLPTDKAKRKGFGYHQYRVIVGGVDNAEEVKPMSLFEQILIKHVYENWKKGIKTTKVKDIDATLFE